MFRFVNDEKFRTDYEREKIFYEQRLHTKQNGNIPNRSFNRIYTGTLCTHWQWRTKEIYCGPQESDDKQNTALHAVVVLKTCDSITLNAKNIRTTKEKQHIELNRQTASFIPILLDTLCDNTWMVCEAGNLKRINRKSAVNNT